MGIYIAVAGVWVVLFGWLGGWVASQCGRGGLEGMLLGAFFGPIGVIVEALLPHFPGDTDVRKALNEARVRGRKC